MDIRNYFNKFNLRESINEASTSIEINYSEFLPTQNYIQLKILRLL